jgi:hypothetical protein
MASQLELGDPRIVRQQLHTAYDRYIQGDHLFPRIRPGEEVTAEQFSKKTQPIMAALLREWGIIREDEATFGDTVDTLVTRGEREVTPGTTWKGFSAIRVGRNAVRVGIVEVSTGETPTLTTLLSSVRSFHESFGGLQLGLRGDEHITIGEDMIAANPDRSPNMVFVRRSNATGVYIPTTG